MFMFKTIGRVAKSGGNRMPWKVVLAGAFLACTFGGFAVGLVWATPSSGQSTTIISGPIVLDQSQVVTESRDHGVIFKTKGQSDVYVVYNKIAPGGHTGWHSHPGPSIVSRTRTSTADRCRRRPHFRRFEPRGARHRQEFLTAARKCRVSWHLAWGGNSTRVSTET